MRNRRRLEDLGGRVASIEAVLDKLERSMERIELVTVIREPNTGMTADAYNGLRKQVVAAANERMAHLQQLAQFDASLQAGATPDELAALVREWFGQSQLEVVEDTEIADAFETVGPERAHGRRLLRAAYVDGLSGRVIRGGVIERVEEAPDQPARRSASNGDGSDGGQVEGEYRESVEPATTEPLEGNASGEESIAGGKE